MQLDFTQLQSKFEKISGLRPMPHREYVEFYVKAYYFPEIELEIWIRAHSVSIFIFSNINLKLNRYFLRIIRYFFPIK